MDGTEYTLEDILRKYISSDYIDKFLTVKRSDDFFQRDKQFHSADDYLKGQTVADIVKRYENRGNSNGANNIRKVEDIMKQYNNLDFVDYYFKAKSIEDILEKYESLGLDLCVDCIESNRCRECNAPLRKIAKASSLVKTNSRAYTSSPDREYISSPETANVSLPEKIRVGSFEWADVSSPDKVVSVERADASSPESTQEKSPECVPSTSSRRKQSLRPERIFLRSATTETEEPYPMIVQQYPAYMSTDDKSNREDKLDDSFRKRRVDRDRLKDKRAIAHLLSRLANCKIYEIDDTYNAVPRRSSFREVERSRSRTNLKELMSEPSTSHRSVVSDRNIRFASPVCEDRCPNQIVSDPYQHHKRDTKSDEVKILRLTSEIEHSLDKLRRVIRALK